MGSEMCIRDRSSTEFVAAVSEFSLALFATVMLLFSSTVAVSFSAVGALKPTIVIVIVTVAGLLVI